MIVRPLHLLWSAVPAGDPSRRIEVRYRSLYLVHIDDHQGPIFRVRTPSWWPWKGGGFERVYTPGKVPRRVIEF
jgi:hypothetical protein